MTGLSLTKNRIMKTVLRLLSALSAALFLVLFSADYHPPPAGHGGCAPLAFAGGTSPAAPLSGCMLDPNYEPVEHTARRQVEQIFRPLALAAGKDPGTYSLELMRDRRGHRAINAMTCPHSRVIWISVTAWERLSEHEPALALILAHELAHADHRHPSSLTKDPMTAAERRILSRLTTRQKIEVAADHRAADLMARAGYTARQINTASRYILASDESGFLSSATPSHPGGRDRINLMTFYLGRTMLPSLAR